MAQPSPDLAMRVTAITRSAARRLTLIAELREISRCSGLTHSTGRRSQVIPGNLGDSEHASRVPAQHFAAGPVPGRVRTAARLMYVGAVLNAISVLYYGFAT